ncbi:MAG: circadian clock protein KaiC [Legionellaceae bacterium]|nr:circadian clock protein KaiC [Legionellaceae bacterium]
MEKISTGIEGLDQILTGGYPKGKVILVKGSSGSGKTILTECFIQQALNHDYQVVAINTDEPITTPSSEQLKILDFFPRLSDEIIGEFEMDALLLRIKNSINQPQTVVVIDSLQNLFMGLETAKPAQCLMQLFQWCRDHHVTLLVTVCEEGVKGLNAAFEEYQADCIITLWQNIRNKLMTRFLRIKKYRHTTHGTNEYPFLITNEGISIVPITSINQVTQQVSEQRCSTGIADIDHMLGGGYFEGSSILISGESGTAKSILAGTIALSAVQEKKKVLFISYEESLSAYVMHIKSAGIDFEQALKSHMIHFKCLRSVEKGIEEHLIAIIDDIKKTKPKLVVIDPISSLIDLGSTSEVKSLLLRLVSYLEQTQVSLILTELLKAKDSHDKNHGPLFVSSVIDTWIKLLRVKSNGELNRALYIAKSRGTKTSKQMKEFHISPDGIQIETPYIGEGRVLFGSEKEQQRLIDKETLDALVIPPFLTALKSRGLSS